MALQPFGLISVYKGNPSLLCVYQQPKKYHLKHSSVESLMVETVLESFDFLNADCSADELSSLGSIRTRSVRWVLRNVQGAKELCSF